MEKNQEGIKKKHHREHTIAHWVRRSTSNKRIEAYVALRVCHVKTEKGHQNERQTDRRMWAPRHLHSGVPRSSMFLLLLQLFSVVRGHGNEKCIAEGRTWMAEAVPWVVRGSSYRVPDHEEIQLLTRSQDDNVCDITTTDVTTTQHIPHSSSIYNDSSSVDGLVARGGASICQPCGDDVSISTDLLSLSDTSKAIVDDEDEKCSARAKFVKAVLHRRLQYVCSGQRMNDFAKFVRHHKNTLELLENYVNQTASATDTYINSAASTNVSTVAIALPSKKSDKQLMKQLQADPFSRDRMNMDIVATEHTPQDCFVDHKKQLENELKPPTKVQLTFRALHLSIHFAPVWSTSLIALVSKSFRDRIWYKWLATSIGQSGAAWIKWGQWSSTRNDMFPDSLCDALSSLHASAPAHSWSYSSASVAQSLGLGPDTLECVFDYFSPTPLASGSIAQVHRAVLAGVPVAVKIRHPRVVQLMEMDFRLMTLAATLADRLPGLSWLRIRESVEQFSHTMAAQAYLQTEAHHLERLNYNFRKWPRVKFPTPFYASSSVIIETFEQGKIATDIIDKYDTLAHAVNEHSGMAIGNSNDKSDNRKIVGPADLSTNDQTAMDEPSWRGHDLMPVELGRFLVSTGVSLYLKMLLRDNLMHADLHPGNILVDTQSRSKQTNRSSRKFISTDRSPAEQHQEDVLEAMDDTMDKIQITLVDAGMVASLKEEESVAFIGLLSSLGEGDGKEAAKYALKFSVENSMTDDELTAFQDDMVLLFAERCRGYGTQVDVGHVLRGVLGLIRVYKVRIDANFATLVINCLCIESLARRVCPTYNVLDAAQPLLRGYQRLTFENPNNGKVRRSRLFSLWMGLNAVKKELGDRSFFAKEARIKRRTQQIVSDIVNV